MELFLSLVILAVLIVFAGTFVRKANEKERQRWEAMTPEEREAETKKIEAEKEKISKENELAWAKVFKQPIFENTTDKDVKITYRIDNVFRLETVEPGETSIFPKDSELVDFKSP